MAKEKNTHLFVLGAIAVVAVLGIVMMFTTGDKTGAAVSQTTALSPGGSDDVFAGEQTWCPKNCKIVNAGAAAPALHYIYRVKRDKICYCPRPGYEQPYGDVTAVQAPRPGDYADVTPTTTGLTPREDFTPIRITINGAEYTVLNFKNNPLPEGTFSVKIQKNAQPVDCWDKNGNKVPCTSPLALICHYTDCFKWKCL